MQLRIIPLNVVEEEVHAQLFPPDGDYVPWIRANNPDYPEFDVGNVELYLFHLEEDVISKMLTVPKTYDPLIREHLRRSDGFGDYDTVFLEVDMELLLQYTTKEVSIVRLPKGQGNLRILLHIWLDDDLLIEDWIEASMPEPWRSESH